MAFVLETLTQEQHAIAYSKKNRDEIMHKGIYAYTDWSSRSHDCWVIDHERNAFFICLRVIEPQDASDRFLLGFEGEPLVTVIKSTLSGPRVLPIELPEQFKSQLEEIRTVIVDALKILGRRGTGRLNEFDSLPLHFE